MGETEVLGSYYLNGSVVTDFHQQSEETGGAVGSFTFIYSPFTEKFEKMKLIGLIKVILRYCCKSTVIYY